MAEALGGLDKWERDDIEWALARLRERRPDYAKYARYMDGKHDLSFVTSDYRRAFGEMLQSLRANLCPAVVHAHTDRLKVKGFKPHDSAKSAAPEPRSARRPATPEGGEATGTSKPATAAKRERAIAGDGPAAVAWDIWQDNTLARIENQLTAESVASGDAYIIVWPDADNERIPRFYPQDAASCCVKYDAEDKTRVMFGAKLWPDGEYWRLTLYYPDEARGIRKYRTKNAVRGERNQPVRAVGFERWQPDDDTVWPVPNPYGEVPLFAFPFDAKLGEPGRSQLKDVIPLQDGLNKVLSDLIIASEYGAYAQRWATGIEPTDEWEEITDAEGNAVEYKRKQGELPFKAGIQRILTIGDSEAKFGSFPAADLSKYHSTIELFATMIAWAKGIPPHYFFLTGTFPSGESLKTSEGRLVARIRDMQTAYGDIWARVMTFALRIAGEVPSGDSAKTGPVASIVTQWEEPESRSESELLTNAKTAHGVGLPLEAILVEVMKLSPDIVDFIMGLKDEADAATKAAEDEKAEKAAALFDAGRAPTGAPLAPNGKPRGAGALSTIR